jgi:hypothetical protein
MRGDVTGFGFGGVWGPMNTNRGAVTEPNSGSMGFYAAGEYGSTRNYGTGFGSDGTYGGQGRIYPAPTIARHRCTPRGGDENRHDDVGPFVGRSDVRVTSSPGLRIDGTRW